MYSCGIISTTYRTSSSSLLQQNNQSIPKKNHREKERVQVSSLEKSTVAFIRQLTAKCSSWLVNYDDSLLSLFCGWWEVQYVDRRSEPLFPVHSLSCLNLKSCPSILVSACGLNWEIKLHFVHVQQRLSAGESKSDKRKDHTRKRVEQNIVSILELCWSFSVSNRGDKLSKAAITRK